jgi:hypothetical protein
MIFPDLELYFQKWGSFHVEYFHTFVVAFPAANTSLVPISRGKRLVAYTPCSDHGRSLPHHSEKFFI